MNHVQSIDIDRQTGEEKIAAYDADFPYLASCAVLDRYPGGQVPWHWHRMVEVFLVKSGTIEYRTPGGTRSFPAGTGGFVNSNVLHSSRIPASEETVQMLHLFDPIWIAGERNSRIDRKYVQPLTAGSGVELMLLDPEIPEQSRILERIRQAFELPEEEPGYELSVRAAMSEIWLELFRLAEPQMCGDAAGKAEDAMIKQLMIYLQEHLAEEISVEQMAELVHISTRSCYRLFRDNLHMSPMEYLRSCRLLEGLRLLNTTEASVTEIAVRCGLGTGSYFGKLFREVYGCTPLAYRKGKAEEIWHDREKN